MNLSVETSPSVASSVPTYCSREALWGCACGFVSAQGAARIGYVQSSPFLESSFTVFIWSRVRPDVRVHDDPALFWRLNDTGEQLKPQ